MRSVDPRDTTQSWAQSTPQDASYVERALGLVLLLSLAIGCILVLRPFLTAILLSVILCVSTWGAVSAAFCAIRAVLPRMESRGWGRIIDIASARGLVIFMHEAAYIAATHGVLGPTKAVALEAATTGATWDAMGVKPVPGSASTSAVGEKV